MINKPSTSICPCHACANFFFHKRENDRKEVISLISFFLWVFFFDLYTLNSMSRLLYIHTLSSVILKLVTILSSTAFLEINK